MNDDIQSSVFEVGCGNGSYLYFFKKDGFKVGGLDYAENLLNITRRIIGEENLIECICSEAENIPTEIKYDAVFSVGVFPYFESIEYAERVLNKMLAKANKSIGVLNTFDAAKKESYIEFRRSSDPNYDERYKNLDRLFTPKEFFIEYANKNNLDIKFEPCQLKSYWNAPYIFDCFMYKK